MYEQEHYKLTKDLAPEDLDVLRHHQVVLAGGALTSVFSRQPIRDYDFYFTNAREAYAVMGFYQQLADMGQVTQVDDTEQATTFKDVANRGTQNTYQMIHLPETFCTQPFDLIAQFDFTICQAALDLATGKFVFGAEFLYHLAQRRLVFNPKCRFPICALHRVQKFTRRGFQLAGVEAIKIALAIQALPANWLELRRQLRGVDVALLRGFLLQVESLQELPYTKDAVIEHLIAYLAAAEGGLEAE